MNTTNMVVNIGLILLVCILFFYLSFDLLKKFNKVNKLEFSFKIISKKINLIYASFLVVTVLLISFLILIIVKKQNNSNIINLIYYFFYVSTFAYILVVICLLQLNQKGLIVMINKRRIFFLDQSIEFDKIKRICYNKSHRFIYFFDIDGRFIKIGYNILIREELENNLFELELVN